MKKTLYVLMAAAAVAISCAKQPTAGKSTLAKEALDDFVKINYPTAVETSLGVYILPESEVSGTGVEVGDSAYVRLHYTTSTPTGDYSTSTLESINRQMDTYTEGNYYGPVIWYRGDNNMAVGLEELLMGSGTAFGPMKMGGTRKAIVPGWLTTKTRYSKKEDYVAKVSGTTVVYEISLKNAFGNEEVWEKDSLARYVAKELPGAVEDTEIAGVDAKGGWYIKTTKPGINDNALAKDSLIYCNYTLSRLDGTVVDSNIEKVAKDNGFYSSKVTYAPKQITWDEDYKKIVMTSGETDVVDGFANAFLHMHQYESATVVFWSYLGYYYTPKSGALPAYCPLRFDIELVEAPK